MDDKGKNFYANAVNFAASLYDVTLVFKSQAPQIDDTGKVMEINGLPVLNVTDELTVRMSPQHAKALATILVKNLVEYEKQFKLQLPMTPELEAFWKELIKGS